MMLQEENHGFDTTHKNNAKSHYVLEMIRLKFG